MKNLFILGNGFDIDLGLNTTFKAFRESYEFQSIANIIFGQSFGITDSDYFKPYFEAITKGNIQQQNLYIITYNKESKNNIIQNMKQYGINFDYLLKSNININIIYTEKGSQSFEFKKMISNIYNSSM